MYRFHGENVCNSVCVLDCAHVLFMRAAEDCLRCKYTLSATIIMSMHIELCESKCCDKDGKGAA